MKNFTKTQDWVIQMTIISKNSENSLYSSSLITNATNVKIRTSVEWLIVETPKTPFKTLKPKSLFAPSAQQYQLEQEWKTANSMVQKTLILSANSVVLLHFGSATAILITVTLAIREQDAMINRIARVKTKKKVALLKLTILPAEKNLLLDVGFVEALWLMLRISER